MDAQTFSEGASDTVLGVWDSISCFRVNHGFAYLHVYELY